MVLGDPEQHELRSYRILDGVVTEEPVTVVEQYQPAESEGNA